MDIDLVPIVLFICITLSIKFIVDSRLRRRLAETNASEDLIKAMLVADEETRRHGALKWGIVLTVIGAAFGLIDLFNLRPDDPSTFGLLLGAAGVGMLGFHVLTGRRA